MLGRWADVSDVLFGSLRHHPPPRSSIAVAVSLWNRIIQPSWGYTIDLGIPSMAFVRIRRCVYCTSLEAIRGNG